MLFVPKFTFPVVLPDRESIFNDRFSINLRITFWPISGSLILFPTVFSTLAEVSEKSLPEMLGTFIVLCFEISESPVELTG